MRRFTCHRLPPSVHAPPHGPEPQRNVADIRPQHQQVLGAVDRGDHRREVGPVILSRRPSADAVLLSVAAVDVDVVELPEGGLVHRLLGRAVQVLHDMRGGGDEDLTTLDDGGGEAGGAVGRGVAGFGQGVSLLAPCFHGDLQDGLRYSALPAWAGTWMR